MTEQQEYTWDDLQNAVGRDFSDGQTRYATDVVERWAIRAFCEPMEMDCPLHWDDDEARKWGYRGIIAPHSSISFTFTTIARWHPGDPTRWTDPHREDAAYQDNPRSNSDRATKLPMPPTSQSFLADLEVEYYRPVYVGDRLGARGQKLLSVKVRRTSVGFGAFLTFEREVVNQYGELVAHVRSGSYRFNPEPASEGHGKHPA